MIVTAQTASELTNAAAPIVSVVICTHNRGFYLRKAIASVVGQDMPASEYELIIVDNKSTDDTAEVAASFAAPNVRYIHEPQLGLCFARNTGWRNAAGTYVAYLDDDAIAEPGWLASIKAAFESDPAAGVVGGKVDPIWEGERPAWMSDNVSFSLTIVDWSIEPKQIPDVRVEWLVGANMAIPRSVLAEVGGFDPRLDRIGTNMLSGGDVFLQKQILGRGYTCLYHPGMAVRHLVPPSRLHKKWFRRRYYWQGVSDAVMELITDNPSTLGRFWRGLVRAGELLAKPRALVEIFLPTDHPDKFQERCFTIIAIGHVVGLLGVARR
jgi:glycosyltransferase involved in cell wall biosynthesis